MIQRKRPLSYLLNKQALLELSLCIFSQMRTHCSVKTQN